MRFARFMLKIAALILTAAAIACALIAYWDTITDLFGALRNKIKERKCCRPAEYDDYVDWEG